MKIQKLNPFARCAVLALGVLGCGDKPAGSTSRPEATLTGACYAVCHKLEACDALNGIIVDDCIRGCRREDVAAESGSADACSITDEQASECISAIDDFSCPSLSRGDFPPACSFCEDTRAGARNRAGSGAAASDSGAGCASLRTCCDQIVASDQQSFCNMVVRMNNPGLCAAVLPGYRSADQCR